MMQRFVNAALTGDIYQALFPSIRACIPACTGKFKSTNSVQQFHCNEKNRRRGSATRQIRRRLNIKWDMTGALFLFRFHVLAPLWCVWARAKELCAFFPLFDVEREESLLDRTRHGPKARSRDEKTPPVVRWKRLYEAMQTSHYTKVLEDSNLTGIQRHKNPKRDLKKVRKYHTSQQSNRCQVTSLTSYWIKILEIYTTSGENSISYKTLSYKKSKER